MHNAAPEIVAGYPSGSVVDKDANPETTLGSAYSPVDYMSITSFPRLPEDDVSGENTLKSRKDDDNVLSEQDTGQTEVIKENRLSHTQSWLQGSFFCDLLTNSVWYGGAVSQTQICFWSRLASSASPPRLQT